MPDKQCMEMEPARFASSFFDSVTPFEVLMVEELSDVNLVIGSNIIAVHQIILAAHSTLLAGKTESEPRLMVIRYRH